MRRTAIPRHSVQRSVKRILDIAGSCAAILALSPLLLLVAAAVRIWLGSPILFRQRRPGLHGRPFLMYKFRTMRDAYDAAGRPLPDAQRLTALGRWLRTTSLDELPELYNVLRGEMSLVGPRPLLMEYLNHYTPQQARRLDAIPGITGWAQINGRNSVSWEEKFALDVWYVDHWTLEFDLRILLATMVKVLRRDGISADGHCTMPEFTGSANDGTKAA